MRNLIGKATPKEYAELNASLIAALLRFVSTIGARFAPLNPSGVSTWPFRRITSSLNLPTKLREQNLLFHRAARVLMPNLFLTISTWGINVVLSDSLPAKTDTATGQPRSSVTRP